MAEHHDPIAASYLATPDITVASGYTARVLVPPGTLYDPLFPISGEGDDIWLNDDGGEEGEGGGGLYRVQPNGTVTPLVPAGFGPYAGDLFVADIGGAMPVPKDKALPRNGRIHRVDKEGKLHAFAQGFAMPLGLRFIGNRLIACDVNGDYIGGGQELADGFVVEITAQA